MIVFLRESEKGKGLFSQEIKVTGISCFFIMVAPFYFSARFDFLLLAFCRSGYLVYILWEADFIVCMYTSVGMDWKGW